MLVDREATIDTLNQTVVNMTEQKRQLMADVAALSQKCEMYKDNTRKCQATLNRQNQRLQALFQMSQAMAIALLKPGDVPPEYHRHYVGYIFRDILHAHTTLIRASTRVQKAFRGHRGRLAFLSSSRPRGVPLPLPWHRAVRDARRGVGAVGNGLRTGGGGQSRMSVVTHHPAGSGLVLGYLGASWPTPLDIWLAFLSALICLDAAAQEQSHTRRCACVSSDAL